MLSLEMLVTAFPQQLWLEIEPQKCEEIEERVTEYSSDAARRRAVLNTLCGEAIADWLRSDPDEEAESILVESDPKIWEFVNGITLQLGSTRLVLIPRESADTEELLVPWEWLDIPGWKANYYLGVQMSLESDEHWLRVWGFASHGVVKEGRKDNMWRTYGVERADLTEDLNVLWLSREFCPQALEQSEASGFFSEAEAQRWLDRLGQPSTYSPRLEIPFERWAALLADDKWRHNLYQKRLGRSLTKRIHLGQWLHGLIEEGWDAMESVLGPYPALAFRGATMLQRGKRLSLAHSGVEIALCLAIAPLSNTKQQISVELFPLGDRVDLPPELQLIILDEQGQTAMQAAAGQSESLEFEFRGSAGEHFSVKVVLGEFSVTEEFVI